MSRKSGNRFSAKYMRQRTNVQFISGMRSSVRAAEHLASGAIVIALWAALVILPLIFIAFGQTYFVTILTRIVILAPVAVSLDLLIGYGGLLSFGHAAFFGLGGYVVGILLAPRRRVPFLGWEGTNSALVAWPLAVLGAALAALAIGALWLRTSGFNFIMITLAFSQMMCFLSSR